MDLDKKLIKEIKNYPALYNPNDSMYRDPDFKQQLWITIGRKLIGGEDEKTSVAALKVRWKSLRDAYVKERKRDLADTYGLKLKKKRPWRLKTHMEFLAPYIVTRKEISDSVAENEASTVCGDVIETFFRRVADTVKTLSIENQLTVRRDIANVVLTYKLRELEELDQQEVASKMDNLQQISSS